MVCTREDPFAAASLDEREIDVAIIGGGVIGICAAYFLARAGRRVMVLEKDRVASGCTFANAGLAGPRYALPLAAPGIPSKALRWMWNPDSPIYIPPRPDPSMMRWLWRFTRAARPGRVRRVMPVLRQMHSLSVDLFDELAQQRAFEFDLAHAGQLMVYSTTKGLRDGRKDARLLEEVGVESRLLDHAQLLALLPYIADDIAGGIHYPADVHLNPASFTLGLAAAAGDLGVEVRERTEVLAIEHRGRALIALETTRGRLHPKEVVLAAGSWSPGLARSLGLSIPLQPAKGYSITMECPAEFPVLGMLLGEAKVAVTHMGRLLRFAGTLELVGMDLSVNQRRVNAIRRAVSTYLPKLAPPSPLEIWRGLRPVAPDNLPYLGRPRDIDNLIVATGHAMIGLSLGPATGKLVAQIAQGEQPDVDLTLMRPDRHG